MAETESWVSGYFDYAVNRRTTLSGTKRDITRRILAEWRAKSKEEKLACASTLIFGIRGANQIETSSVRTKGDRDIELEYEREAVTSRIVEEKHALPDRPQTEKSLIPPKDKQEADQVFTSQEEIKFEQQALREINIETASWISGYFDYAVNRRMNLSGIKRDVTNQIVEEWRAKTKEERCAWLSELNQKDTKKQVETSSVPPKDKQEADQVFTSQEEIKVKLDFERDALREINEEQGSWKKGYLSFAIERRPILSGFKENITRQLLAEWRALPKNERYIQHRRMVELLGCAFTQTELEVAISRESFCLEDVSEDINGNRYGYFYFAYNIRPSLYGSWLDVTRTIVKKWNAFSEEEQCAWNEKAFNILFEGKREVKSQSSLVVAEKSQQEMSPTKQKVHLPISSEVGEMFASSRRSTLKEKIPNITEAQIESRIDYEWSYAGRSRIAYIHYAAHCHPKLKQAGVQKLQPTKEKIWGEWKYEMTESEHEFWYDVANTKEIPVCPIRVPPQHCFVPISKKPLSSYGYYASERYPELKKVDPNMSSRDLINQMSHEWDNMDDQKRQRWVDFAHQDKQLYVSKLFGDQSNKPEETPEVVLRASQENIPIPTSEEPVVNLKDRLLAFFDMERFAFNKRFHKNINEELGEKIYGYLYFAYRRRITLYTEDTTGDIFKEWQKLLWVGQSEWMDEARDLLTMLKIGRNPAEFAVDIDHRFTRRPKLLIEEAKDAFHHFSRETRPKLKKVDPFCSYSEMNTRVCKAFDALSTEEHQKWKDIAIADKARYEREMLAYNSSM
jgi:hypothetical protein